MPDKNSNGFIRAIFWALVIGSFGWTTFLGIWQLGIVDANDKCRQQEDKEIRQEMQMCVKEINDQFKIIVSQLSAINTELKYLNKEKEYNYIEPKKY